MNSSNPRLTWQLERTEMQQIEAKCRECGKSFKKLVEDPRSNDPARDICYGCALESFSGGRCPEEGDFNSARIVSGEMSEKEYRDLMKELRAVELGIPLREPYIPEDEDDPWDTYYDDPSR